MLSTSSIKKTRPKSGINSIYISLIILAIFAIIAAVALPKAYQLGNLQNIIRINSPACIMAIGVTLVLLTGEIDISVGSTMSLTIMAGTMVLPYSEVAAIVLALGLGTLCGFVNGIIITKTKVPSLIVTIGTMQVYYGLACIVTNAQPTYISQAYPLFLALGNEEIAGIPLPFIICIAVVLGFWYLTTKTRFGKNIYYTGANKRAAFMSGIDINKTKLIAFTLCGLLAAASGPLLSSQLGQADPRTGLGYELTAIAIAVLGGTALTGGKGNVLGTFLGMITLGLLLNMLALSGMGTYVEMTLNGVLIIVVVFVFSITTQRRATR